MKKIFSALLITILTLSLLSSFAVPVFAEGSETEVSVNESSEVIEEVSETVSEDVSENNEDGKYANTIRSLEIMGFGMFGIFLVTAIIVCVMYLLTLLKDKKA
ncbi:MAG: hypothetical protein IKC06_00725 [Clostridia bacterium]|nr:hypothetical protein [Clostridia bacterium]